MHAARERSLLAAREKLEGMLAAKRQLEVEVENLEARRQMIAAAETTSEFQFDDSHLGRVKELIADLGARLDVADKMVAAQTDYHDEIPLDEPSEENIVEQVSRYFGEPDDSELAATE
jgi:tRNA U34 5-carboxymethylaminomethyl modifying GTPase MnmE/TrmE